MKTKNDKIDVLEKIVNELIKINVGDKEPSTIVVTSSQKKLISNLIHKNTLYGIPIKTGESFAINTKKR